MRRLALALLFFGLALPTSAQADTESITHGKGLVEANCSHCHMKWGGGNAEFQLLATLDVKDTGTIGVRPAHGFFDLKDPKLLAPGEPDRARRDYPAQR